MRVVFSHGLESTPQGTKARRFATIAARRGLAFEAIDYRGIADVGVRVEKLAAAVSGRAEPLLFVGSSVGGHVATAVAGTRPVAGLFLIAPAFYMPGYEALTPAPPSCRTVIVHGWRDAVVPVDNVIRFARNAGATLHVVDDEHRLLERLDEVVRYFEDFLDELTPRG